MSIDSIVTKFKYGPCGKQMQLNARNEKKQELIPTKSNHQTTGLVSRDGLRLARFKPPLASAESNLSDMTHVKTVKTAKRMMKMVSEQVGASCWIIQWEIQDPKMEVLYHIRPYFVGIFPYIGLV